MPVRITAPDDARLAPFRAVRRPAVPRASSATFPLEGRQAVARALTGGRCVVRAVLLNDAAFRALESQLKNRPDVLVYTTSQECLNQIAGFDVHRGCIGIADREPSPSVESMLVGSSRLVVLEAVANPDNIGGVFRNAAAFGVDGVLLSPGCADPLYPKAIRTSAAATLKVPFAIARPWPDVLGRLRTSGLQLVGLTPDSRAVSLEAAMPSLRTRRLAVLVGTESHGLTRGAMDAADVLVRIPMAPGVDSLNVAVAVGIVLSRVFEASPE